MVSDSGRVPPDCEINCSGEFAHASRLHRRTPTYSNVPEPHVSEKLRDEQQRFRQSMPKSHLGQPYGRIILS